MVHFVGVLVVITLFFIPGPVSVFACQRSLTAFCVGEKNTLEAKKISNPHRASDSCESCNVGLIKMKCA